MLLCEFVCLLQAAKVGGGQVKGEGFVKNEGGKAEREFERGNEDGFVLTN